MSNEIIEEKSGAHIASADILWLSGETAAFKPAGDFLELTLSAEAAEKLASRLAEQAFTEEQKTPGADELTHFSRVSLHRAFPFDEPDGFISVFTPDGTEIGIIRNLDELSEAARSAVVRELDRKYYTPKVRRIISIREKRGFSVWRIDTDAGVLELSLRDTFRSIIRAGEDRVFIADASGGRYEIESLKAFDPASLKKLEIYL